ncbi:MAG: FecR domain-containing protein [Deltaproteobacteria bacterium]|nr:FecR domain-containing protein [Deltaproteobacteria bacterium]
MNCGKLEVYLERRLSELERHQFRRHADGCPECREAVERHAAQAALLRSFVEDRLDSTPEPERLRALRERSARRRTRAPRRWVWGAAAAALLAAGLAAVLVVRTQGTASRSVAPQREAPPPALGLAWISPSGEAGPSRAPEVGRTIAAPTAVPVRLQAGPARIGLEPEGRLGLERADAERLSLRLDHGAVVLDVTPSGAGPRVEVRAGEHRVSVVGTRFRVSRSDDGGVRVEVDRGTVRVDGPFAEGRLVRAGRSLAVAGARSSEAPLTPSDRARILALLEGDTVAPAAAAPAVPQATIVVTPDAPPLAAAPGEVVALAPEVAGEPPAAAVPAGPVRDRTPAAPFDPEALRERLLAGETGPVTETLAAHLARQPRDAEAWWLMAAARRRGRDPSGERAAYERLIDVGSPADANRARFLAAVVSQDRLGDAAAAADHLTTYLALPAAQQTHGVEARLRLARAWITLGRTAQAASLLRALVEEERGQEPAEEAARLLGEIEGTPAP